MLQGSVGKVLEPYISILNLLIFSGSVVQKKTTTKQNTERLENVA